jgi:hypothetical protein
MHDRQHTGSMAICRTLVLARAALEAAIVEKTADGRVW